MKLSLNHIQRLNLIALLGAQRANVDGIRMIWKIQDRLALDDEEARVIELRTQVVGGQEVRVWNPEVDLPVKECEFTEPEIVRIREALQTWPEYQAGARGWLEPLLERLS